MLSYLTGVHTHPPVPVVVKIPAHLQGDGQLIIHLWFATVHSELTHTIGMSAGENTRVLDRTSSQAQCARGIKKWAGGAVETIVI